MKKFLLKHNNKLIILSAFLLLTIISFSTTEQTAAAGFEKFVSWSVTFKDMSKYLLQVIGTALLIWGLFNLFNGAEAMQIIIKLIGGLLLFTIGMNMEKTAVAVGGTLLNPIYLETIKMIGGQMGGH